MKVITGYEGQGKTYRLIKESAKTGKYIVCFSMREADRVFREALKNGYQIPLPITFDEFLNGRYSFNINGLLIDNADKLLQMMSKVNVDVISYRKEAKNDT